jgi:hypothetical protein
MKSNDPSVKTFCGAAHRPTMVVRKTCHRHHLGVFCSTAGVAEPPGCSGTLALPNTSSFVWDNDRDFALDAAGDWSAGTRLRRYDDAYVDSEGSILLRRDGDTGGCRVLRNGGCHRRMRAMDPLLPGVREFDSVVTLATHFGAGHYHFPLESLIGLAAANISLAACLAKGARRCSRTDGGSKCVTGSNCVTGPNCVPGSKCVTDGTSKCVAGSSGVGCRVHISARDAFHSAWLALAGNVPSKQVIFGQVFARQLWVPQLGRCEAQPTSPQYDASPSPPGITRH